MFPSKLSFSLLGLEAFVLAAGQAVRMGDLCATTPKSMLMVGGRPFLVWVVEHLMSHGIKTSIGTGHLSSSIHSQFDQAEYHGRVLCVKEPTSLGTGGLIRFLSQYSAAEDVLVLNGDTILEVDYSKLEEFHRSHDSPVTQVVTRNSEQNQGAITVNDSGFVVDFAEGREIQASELGACEQAMSSTGCYIFKRDYIMEGFPLVKSSLERDIMPKCCERGDVRAFELPDSNVFFDFGTPDRYARTARIHDKIPRIYSSELSPCDFHHDN